MARLRQEAGKEEAATVTTRMVILSGKVTTVVCKIITRFKAPQHTPLLARRQQACGLAGDFGSRQANVQINFHFFQKYPQVPVQHAVNLDKR
jgi:hypothetical protein